MNEPRQTASYLSKRLAEAGLRPVSKYGQNFLIDLNLVDLIANSAEIRPTDVVLEIGTGVGSLTSRLSDAAGAVLSVEIDKNLHQLASGGTGGTSQRQAASRRRATKQELATRRSDGFSA